MTKKLVGIISRLIWVLIMSDRIASSIRNITDGRLDQFVATRHKLRKRYDLLLNGSQIIKPFQMKIAIHTSISLQINLPEVPKDRKVSLTG